MATFADIATNPFLQGLQAGVAARSAVPAAPAPVDPFVQRVNAAKNYQLLTGGENAMPPQYSTGDRALDIKIQRDAQRRYAMDPRFGMGAAAVQERKAQQAFEAEQAAMGPNAVRDIGGQRFAFRDGRPVGFASTGPAKPMPTLGGGVKDTFTPAEERQFATALDKTLAAAYQRPTPAAPRISQAVPVVEEQQTVVQTPIGQDRMWGMASRPPPEAMLGQPITPARRMDSSPDSALTGSLERARRMAMTGERMEGAVDIADQIAPLRRELEDVRRIIANQREGPPSFIRSMFGLPPVQAAKGFTSKERADAVRREAQLLAEIEKLDKQRRKIEEGK